MARQLWADAPVACGGPGPAVNTTTTETSILLSDCRIGKEANYLQIGKTFDVDLWGQISNIVTTPGTLTFRIRWGTVAGGVILWVSPALALNTTAQTNVAWSLRGKLACRVAGSAANFMFMGRAESVSFTGTPVLLPASAPAVGSNVDTTTANFMDVTAQWSISNAANSVQLMAGSIVSLN